jgi:hypothetical protein
MQPMEVDKGHVEEERLRMAKESAGMYDLPRVFCEVKLWPKAL